MQHLLSHNGAGPAQPGSPRVPAGHRFLVHIPGPYHDVTAADFVQHGAQEPVIVLKVRIEDGNIFAFAQKKTLGYRRTKPLSVDPPNHPDVAAALCKRFCDPPGAILGVVIHYNDLVAAPLHHFLKPFDEERKVFALVIRGDYYRDFGALSVGHRAFRRRRGKDGTLIGSHCTIPSKGYLPLYAGAKVVYKINPAPCPQYRVIWWTSLPQLFSRGSIIRRYSGCRPVRPSR